MDLTEKRYSYLICNPHLITDNQVQFILKEAGLGLFCAYTDFEFAEKLLHALEIDARIEKYEIVPCRCYYYSDYILPKYTWQDR